MITVALAGLGKMGLSHLSIIRPHPLVDLVGVCDPGAPFLGVLAARTDVATFTDYERMLEETTPDAVVIATPSFLHADMVRAALTRGIHVFCEKPLFLDTRDGAELTALAAQRGLVTQVGYHNRFVGTFAEAKRLLEIGAIGTVTNALAEAYGPVVTKPSKGGWRDQRAAGGGCLYDYAAHPVDLLTWYLGPVARASGSRLDSIFSAEVDDTVSSTLEFGSGATAQLSVNWSDESQRKMTTGVTLWGTAGRIKVDRQEIQVFLKPGANTGVTIDEASGPSRTGSWLDFLNGIIPANFLGTGVGIKTATDADGVITSASGYLNPNVLQIIVIALVIGIAALKVGKKADPFLTFNASLLAVVQKVLWWIIRLAPVGTVGLIGFAIADYGWASLASLARFAGAIYIGLALVLFVVYPILLRFNGLSIVSYFKGAWPAIQLGFVSRSSIGTMPVTERVTSRNLGVPEAYAGFAVPLGATTKMDGCASIYPAISAIFVAQFFGIDLNITQYLLIAFVAVIGSTATAGMTGATVMLTLTLSTLGLPLEGVGLLLAIDPILDMGRTAVNVAGQALVPLIVSKREGILDEEKYNSASAQDLFSDDVADEESETTDATSSSVSFVGASEKVGASAGSSSGINLGGSGFISIDTSGEACPK